MNNQLTRQHNNLPPKDFDAVLDYFICLFGPAASLADNTILQDQVYKNYCNCKESLPEPARLKCRYYMTQSFREVLVNNQGLCTWCGYRSFKTTEDLEQRAINKSIGGKSYVKPPSGKWTVNEAEAHKKRWYNRARRARYPEPNQFRALIKQGATDEQLWARLDGFKQGSAKPGAAPGQAQKETT